MSASEWGAALDDFEARITQQRAALRDRSLGTVPPFDPPTLAAPPPPHLLERATELVWRCRELEDDLATAVADAREDLERHDSSQAKPTTPTDPVFFDSRL